VKHIKIGDKMKKKQIKSEIDSILIEQDRMKKEIRMLRNALEDFRLKESMRQNKSEFEVMNFE
tara:strand:- start:234 stop:422 length:189 start_codon:yes stop_codon:yes gene_type:complete